MKIAFLHTLDLNAATFDALLDELAPETERVHRVEPQWLARARQEGMTADLRDSIATALHDFGDADSVVCTCSTLGPVADEVSQEDDHVFRLDRPMMEKAVALGPKILVVMCLESTREPTLRLLADAAERAGRPIAPKTLICDQAWPHFEAGERERFAREIAAAVKAEVARQGEPDCIVLAQASMAGAEELLRDLDVPVLSSPRIATQHAIELAKSA